MKTKILAACLALCMVSTMVPASAFAENNGTVPVVLKEQKFGDGVNNPDGEISGNEDGDFSDTQASDQPENESGMESSVHPSVAGEYYMEETEDSFAETDGAINECEEINTDGGSIELKAGQKASSPACYFGGYTRAAIADNGDLYCWGHNGYIIIYNTEKCGRYGETGYLYNIHSPFNPETGKKEDTTVAVLKTL